MGDSLWLAPRLYRSASAQSGSTSQPFDFLVFIRHDRSSLAMGHARASGVTAASPHDIVGASLPRSQAMAQQHLSAWQITFRRELRGIVLALLLVAATTVIAYGLIKYVGVRRGSVIYLIPVLLAGWHLGLVPALVAAVAGVLWSGYFFFAPFYSYFLARPSEILNLALFMVVAVVTSHLANSMKKQTELARRRENEVSDLYAFSRRVAAAPSAPDIFLAIEEHVATLVRRKVVLFGTGGGDTDPARPQDTAVPDEVRAVVADVQSGVKPATTIGDVTGNIWFVRRVSERTPDFGVIAIDLGSVPANQIGDIRQRVDEALSDAAATLERLDVARALNEARMRSETELLREALIGSVSHELRTPLASILGATTVLAQAPTITTDERLTALTGVIRDEAERLNNDIQNLLDATRITRAQVKPRMEWTEPADIVNSAIERRRRRLASHAISIDMDLNLPFIYVDPVLVEQAFMQVVDNAAKYSPVGSTIKIDARRNGHAVVLAVSDTGGGLTAEETRQIGERFFRADRLAATTSGSGLGLWIAKAFVSANGGKIEAVSPGADQGTTVSIHLPLAKDAPQHEVGPDD
jgi:two-component system sensor histidine kinase KdpD